MFQVDNTITFDVGGIMNRSHISFSELGGHKEMFRSKFDTNFDLTTFGVSSQPSNIRSEDKIAKLADKIRRDVNELALFCAANYKEKLVNVLIINQQLSFINPPPTNEHLLLQNATAPRSINTILQPPTMPQRLKPKAKRNLKVGYGVVTAEEVIEEMEERERADAQQVIEREEDEIQKNKREKQIEEVENQLRETRESLAILKSENAAALKESAPKRKSKKRGNNAEDQSIQIARKQEINSKNEELKELRKQLHIFKANHVAANKAVALKRRNCLQLKKDKGNLIVQPLQQTVDGSRIDLDSDDDL